MSDIRVVNTFDLRALARKAGPGKAPGIRFMESLDPEGLHTLEIALGFMNDAAEHRCKGFAKMPGTNEPCEFEIDVLVTDFVRLAEADVLLARVDTKEKNQ